MPTRRPAGGPGAPGPPAERSERHFENASRMVFADDSTRVVRSLASDAVLENAAAVGVVGLSLAMSSGCFSSPIDSLESCFDRPTTDGNTEIPMVVSDSASTD